MTQKDDDKYIYESPDGGKTVTRRLFGSNIKESLNDIDIDINDVILMNGIDYSSGSISYDADGKVTSVRVDNKELWDIPVDLYSTKVRTLLAVDILQQLKKLVYDKQE